MHFTTLFATALAAISTVSANSFPNPFAEPEEEQNHLAKRSLIAVRGVVKGWSGGARPKRLEIRTFAANKDFVNIFLIALEATQADLYSNPLSHFAVSSIHGVPYQGWNGEANTGSSQTGYCTHGSILFP